VPRDWQFLLRPIRLKFPGWSLLSSSQPDRDSLHRRPKRDGTKKSPGLKAWAVKPHDEYLEARYCKRTRFIHQSPGILRGDQVRDCGSLVDLTNDRYREGVVLEIRN